MSQIINVRMDGEWTDQMYPFTPDTMNGLTGVFGEDNIRLIAETEFERHCLRLRQNAAYEQSEAQQKKDVGKKLSTEESEHSSAGNASTGNASTRNASVGNASAAERASTGNATEVRMTLSELRDKRLAYFQTKELKNRWKGRLRPRK